MAPSREIEKLQRRWQENPLGLTFAPLAEAYRKEGMYEDALELLSIGLAQHPNYVPAHIVRGRCYLDSHTDTAAEEAFRRVTELDPENVIALKGLADLAEKGGRNDEAIDRLERLLEFDRSNDDARAQLERLRTVRARLAAADAAPAVPVAPTPAVSPPVDTVASHGPAAGANAAAAGEEPAVEADAATEPPASAPPRPDEVAEGRAAIVDMAVAEVEVISYQPLELVAGAETEYQLADDAATLRPDAARGDAIGDADVTSRAPAAADTPEPVGAVVEAEPAPIAAPVDEPSAEPALSASAQVTQDAEPPLDVIVAESAAVEVTGATEVESAPADAPIAGAPPIEPYAAAAPFVAAVAEEPAQPAEPAVAELQREPVIESVAPVAAASAPVPLAEPAVAAVQADADGDRGDAPARVEAAVSEPAADESSTDAPAGTGENVVSEEPVLAGAAEGVPANGTPEVATLAAELPATRPADADLSTPDAPIETRWSARPPEAEAVFASSEPADAVETPASPEAEPAPAGAATFTAQHAPDDASEDEAAQVVADVTAEAFDVEALDPSRDDAEAVAGVEAEPELVVTETMAELFLRQGHRTLALAIYTQLAEREPDSPRIRGAIERLQAELRPGGGVTIPAYAAVLTGGQSVRAFFEHLLAATRPTAAAEGSAGGLSLGAVFGEERRPGAASALPVEDAGPSYDEFFAEEAPVAELPSRAASDPEAGEGVTEDLESFTSWLKGLKR